MTIQREGLRWVKQSLKNWTKYFLPEASIIHAKRSIKGQTVIQFGEGNPGALKWTLLPIKLIELIAGLDEMNAFGPYVTRKSLWDYFGKAFSVDLSGAEKALSQMKTRKIELAIFSKELRESVLALVDRSME